MGRKLVSDFLRFLRGNLYIAFTGRTNWTGYTSMKNLISLIDAICEAYDRHDFIPKDGVTYCNQAVAMVADAMGCKDLGFKNADGIVFFIERHPDWQELHINQAQELANQGSLVIAGLDSKTLGQSHGHVCVIRPGKPVYSGKWGACPRVLNIGIENFLARAKKGPLTGLSCGLNEAFVPLPKIWVWRPSL